MMDGTRGRQAEVGKERGRRGWVVSVLVLAYLWVLSRFSWMPLMPLMLFARLLSISFVFSWMKKPWCHPPSFSMSLSPSLSLPLNIPLFFIIGWCSQLLSWNFSIPPGRVVRFPFYILEYSWRFLFWLLTLAVFSHLYIHEKTHLYAFRRTSIRTYIYIYNHPTPLFIYIVFGFWFVALPRISISEPLQTGLEQKTKVYNSHYCDTATTCGRRKKRT